MKRFIASIAMIAMFTGILAGCSSGDSSSSQSSGESNSDKLKIGISMSSRDQFLSSLETAAKNAAGADVELFTYDAENDTQKQLQHITTATSQNFDAMIVNLVETNNANEILQAAGDMPVIFVNRMPPEDLLDGQKAYYVGSNETDSGTIQGNFLTEYFNAQNKTEIDYILFMGTLGLQHTKARTDSAKATLEANGITLNKVFEDTADFDRSKAMEKMQQILGTGQKFDVVICNNDEMALGAIEAMKAAGITDIPVVGIDATTNALVAIESGELACSVFQDAKGQGSGAIDVAKKVAAGESVETITWVPFKLVDSTNVADFK